MVKTQLAVLLLSRLYADIYTSTLSEVSIRLYPAAVTTVYSLSHVIRYTWLLVSATWAIIRLFKARASVDIDENEMTFGQILAVLLLLGPLVRIGWALALFVRRGRGGHIGTLIN